MVGVQPMNPPARALMLHLPLIEDMYTPAVARGVRNYRLAFQKSEATGSKMTAQVPSMPTAKSCSKPPTFALLEVVVFHDGYEAVRVLLTTPWNDQVKHMSWVLWYPNARGE